VGVEERTERFPEKNPTSILGRGGCKELLPFRGEGLGKKTSTYTWEGPRRKGPKEKGGFYKKAAAITNLEN